MSDLWKCSKCGSTYFVYEDEDNSCTKCKIKLTAICEWCEKPEAACDCGKDELETTDHKTIEHKHKK